MSKSKIDTPEKKRKRDAEVAEDAPKKSKKSKKADNVEDARHLAWFGGGELTDDHPG